jgi:hypothetical protein
MAITHDQTDELVEFDWRQKRNGTDGQLERAMGAIRGKQTARPVELASPLPLGAFWGAGSS